MRFCWFLVFFLFPFLTFGAGFNAPIGPDFTTPTGACYSSIQNACAAVQIHNAIADYIYWDANASSGQQCRAHFKTGGSDAVQIRDCETSCPAGQERFNGSCVNQCSGGSVRQSDGSCACPSGQYNYGSGCTSPPACNGGSINSTTGLCQCPGGAINVGGTCICGSDSVMIGGVCKSKMAVCDPTSASFSATSCAQFDGGCPSGTQPYYVNGQKTCASKIDCADPSLCGNGDQSGCSGPSSPGFVGYVNDTPICSKPNSCGAGQTQGVLNGQMVCVNNEFGPPSCNAPRVLVNGACVSPQTAPGEGDGSWVDISPTDSAPHTCPDGSLASSSGSCAGHMGPNGGAGGSVGVGTGAGSSQGVNGGENAVDGSGNENPNKGKGACDPTQPNYAVCIGETQTTAYDPATQMMAGFDKSTADSLDEFFGKKEVDLNDQLPVAMADGASGLSSSVNAFLFGSISCSAMTLNFPGHPLVMPCDRFNDFKVWFGWFLYVATGIYLVRLGMTPLGEK